MDASVGAKIRGVRVSQGERDATRQVAALFQALSGSCGQAKAAGGYPIGAAKLHIEPQLNEYRPRSGARSLPVPQFERLERK